MTSGRYQTGSYPFQKEYAENALLQKGFNQQIIVDLVQYILRKFPDAKTRPLSILDLCCGDGGATNALLNELHNNGVKVEKIVGVDIAPEQIERAHAYTKQDARLEFKVQNVEKMTYANEFDVVVSLFGLHWMENIDHVAKLMSLALKPAGVTAFFVPLEKNDLFEMRRHLMKMPEWKEFFSDFTIHPFIDNDEKYLSAFSNYFIPDNQSGVSGDQPVYFSEEAFARFLSSWMQEVRYLKGIQNESADPGNYLKHLVSGIKPSEDPAADVSVISVEGVTKIRFLEKFFWYHASKESMGISLEIEGELASQNRQK